MWESQLDGKISLLVHGVVPHNRGTHSSMKPCPEECRLYKGNRILPFRVSSVQAEQEPWV